MKPMSPEDREIEQEAAEVARRYRASAREQPPKRLDTAILAAARAEVSAPKRHWRAPVSAAAVLVIGVSLVFLMRDYQPPGPEDRGRRTEDRIDATALSPSDAPVTVAELARPAPSALKDETGPLSGEIAAQVSQPLQAKQGIAPGVPANEVGVPASVANAPRDVERRIASAAARRSESTAANVSTSPVEAKEKFQQSAGLAEFSGTAVGESKAMPAATATALAKNVAIDQTSAERFEAETKPSKRMDRSPADDMSGEAAIAQSPEPLARAERGVRGRAPTAPAAGISESTADTAVAAPSLQAAAATESPEKEIAAIEALLRGGKMTLARTRVAEFARRHPDYVLPPRLKALLPAPTPDQ